MSNGKLEQVIGELRGDRGGVLPIIVNPRRGDRASEGFADAMVLLGALPVAFAEGLKRSKFGELAFFAMLLTACLPHGGENPATTPNNDETGPVDTPTLYAPASDSLHTTEIVFTPVPNPTVISPEIITIGSQLPDWIGGDMTHSGDPGGLTADRADDFRPAVNALEMHGLIPVTDGGGVALSYEATDDSHFFPLVPQITDIATGVVMNAVGVADENGVVTYVSADGTVSDQFLASLQCPDSVACIQAVSYNDGDATVLYFVQVDKDGNIERYVTSGEAADAVSAGQDIPWVEGVSDHWSLDLSGQAALAQIDDLKGIDYDENSGVFRFLSGGIEVTAETHEVDFTTDFGAIVRSDEGTFVWDVRAKD